MGTRTRHLPVNDRICRPSNKLGSLNEFIRVPMASFVCLRLLLIYIPNTQSDWLVLFCVGFAPWVPLDVIRLRMGASVTPQLTDLPEWVEPCPHAFT